VSEGLLVSLTKSSHTHLEWVRAKFMRGVPKSLALPIFVEQSPPAPNNGGIGEELSKTVSNLAPPLLGARGTLLYENWERKTFGDSSHKLCTHPFKVGVATFCERHEETFLCKRKSKAVGSKAVGTKP
jgi:hypothetical protein